MQFYTFLKKRKKKLLTGKRRQAALESEKILIKEFFLIKKTVFKISLINSL
jgi:hypothetical protein